ncbi:MAG: hypothetical protein SFX72_06860 [Isosphaeraceae bacterium]|nr:hypothetical protein [Isosphaeraceae bacterium]
MRYLTTLVFPPYGMILAERFGSAVGCVLLETLALATWRYGIGGALHAVCMLWALNALSGHDEAQRMRRFGRDVRRYRLFGR